MKSIVRWGATLGLIGSTLLSTLFVGNLRALALTQEEIVQKLRPIPVFIVANPQSGELLVGRVNNQQGGNAANAQNNVSVARIFVSQQDAEAFLNKLRTERPELGRNMQVIPRSLGELYQRAQENKNQSERLVFDVVPVQQQVDSALALLRQSGQQDKNFEGVPLFIARGGPDKGYITMQVPEMGEQQIIPVFFSKEDAQNMLNQFKQQNPQQASNADIQVVNLEGVIQTLLSKNDPWLNQLMLVPPPEARQFLRSLQQSSPQNQNRPANRGNNAPARNNNQSAPANRQQNR
ncbi:Tic22 family protein [Aerosakkonema sp. BLCC-F183]|uniref:Tic22 family protein n=1 Tax=Aerosakkonema sp. BLCC-F183 TaxID=3342834 RepID=UPI0035B963D4